MSSAKSIIVSLEPFVRLVERDELLRGFLLDPRPPFSTCQTSLVQIEDALAQALRLALGLNDPEVVLIWGRCRVGTTAIANVFGRAALPTYYQPIKTWLRYDLLDLDLPSLDLSSGKRIVIKETSGPFSLAGCLMDPLGGSAARQAKTRSGLHARRLLDRIQTHRYAHRRFAGARR